MTREEMIALVRKLDQADGAEAELDGILEALIMAVPNGNISDLIFHADPELSIEEVVDEALRREASATE